MGAGQKRGEQHSSEWSECLDSVGRARDIEAFKKLFNFFGPRLKAYFIRIGAPAGLAEDIAQDALLAIWLKADLYDPAKASAAGWIFAIARNLYIDRKRRERPAHGLADLYRTAPEVTPDELMLSSQRDLRVHAALKELPREQFEVIQLGFFEGRTHSEISRTLNVPAGTVKSRSRLAMNRLRGLVRYLE